ncbi:MAG: hypothetical protein ACRC4W_00515 [Treponemataceae bacterium]
MAKEELIDRSPVRFFEQALNGGIKSGEIGIISSKKGIGKTAVLVQIGIDSLFQGKQVVHVSFNQKTSHVMTWYENILTEISKKKNLDKDSIDNIHEQIIKNRIVLNFNQELITTTQIISTIKALSQSGIATQCLIIDGLNFSKMSVQDIQQMKTFAKEANLVVWYSCDTDKTELKEIFSKDFITEFDAIIHFDTNKNETQLKILKVRTEKPTDLQVKLDIKTFLMVNK